MLDSSHSLLCSSAGGDFWVHGFNHDLSYCRDSNTCSNSRYLTWLDGTRIIYNSSLFGLNWHNTYDYCSYIDRVFYPRTNTYLRGLRCFSNQYFMCSALCDDQSEYWAFLVEFHNPTQLCNHMSLSAGFLLTQNLLQVYPQTLFYITSF